MLKTINDLVKNRKEIYSVKADSSLRQAAKYMRDKNVRAVCVMDEWSHLAGILSEWDLVQAIAGECDADQTKVAAVMSRNPMTTDLAATYSECLATMLGNDFQHLVVQEKTNPDGKIWGTVALGDLLKLDRDEKGKLMEQYKSFLALYDKMLDFGHF
ncbi:MAG: CBS domain-containing protein [Acidobacteria bacterium]|nr:CBS domain-containing protein [Acidobacteriota bacterium]MBI3655605.1 CBS domain-containing protein [Acidobacteriota bacterium]